MRHTSPGCSRRSPGMQAPQVPARLLSGRDRVPPHTWWGQRSHLATPGAGFLDRQPPGLPPCHRVQTTPSCSASTRHGTALQEGECAARQCPFDILISTEEALACCSQFGETDKGLLIQACSLYPRQIINC